MDRHQVGATAVGQAARHALPLDQAGPVRGGADHAGEVDTELERQVGLQLVLALGLQQVRPGHAQGLHLDENLAVLGDGVRNLLDRDAGRAFESSDLQ